MNHHLLDVPTHLGADDLLSIRGGLTSLADHTPAIRSLLPTAAEASSGPSLPHPSPPRLTWVPIRSLTSRHRGCIQAHLLALDANDRHLRFGYHASNAQISHYADSIDFERDEVFGIFNRRLELVALAHLAYESSLYVQARGAMAEFGGSVLSTARGRGYGTRLFDHAILHARNRGFETLFIHALSENVAMLKIARRAGAIVERVGNESDAWLRLPPDNLASHVGAAVGQQAAEWDYRLKRQVQRVQGVLEGVAEAHDRIARIDGSGHD